MSVITKCFGIFFALAFSMLSFDAAYAIGVAPSVLDVHVEHNEEVVQVFQVANDGKALASYRIQLIGVTLGEGVDSLSFSVLAPELTSVARVAPSAFALQAGEVGSFQLTVQPSERVPSGVYVLGVQVVQEGLNVAGVNVEQGVVALVFITVGDVPQAGELLDVRASTNASHLPVRVHASVRNVSAGVLQPVGTVTVRNLFGKTTASFPLNEQALRVPQEQTRTFSVVWGDREAQTFFEHIQAEIRQPALGFFTIETHGTFWENGQPFSDTRRVFLFPWRFTLVLLAVATAVYGMLFFTRRKRS